MSLGTALNRGRDARQPVAPLGGMQPAGRFSGSRLEAFRGRKRGAGLHHMPMAGNHLGFRHLCRLAAPRCQHHYLQPQGKLLGSALRSFQIGSV